MLHKKVVFSGKEFEGLRHDLGRVFTVLTDQKGINSQLGIHELEMVVRQLARKAANDAKYEQVVFD